MLRTLELLAPARNADVAVAAIAHGADAVYIGGPSHGARAAAGNSVEDIARVCEYAHRFGARVYVTLNTIVYDSELAEVEQMVWRLYRIGVDALIVQDMSLLRMNLPPIALHASTQCDTRTPEEARFLADVGFSQIVVARECNLGELREICDAVKVPVEAFVHGALCVSYSGDCYASLVCTGRSANRGECAQMCRLPYDLVDGDTGKVLLKQKHLLSLRDMQRIDRLGEMAEAGVRSFKIEGRLKDIDYVKNIVAAYSRALDGVVAAHPDKYRRLSYGRSEVSFTPDASRSFNRGFTPYFFGERRAGSGKSLASMLTPKSIGRRVATVSGYERRSGVIMVDNVTETLNNGDGLGYFDNDGRFCGFRVNRVEGNKLYLRTANGEQFDSESKPTKGTVLYRNSDVAWLRTLSGETAVRTIAVDMRLRLLPDGRIALDIDDERGCSVTSTTVVSGCWEAARTDQSEVQRSVMARLGGTVYRLRRFETEVGGLFIPNSSLATLRRECKTLLDTAWEASRPIERRRKENPDARIAGDGRLTYHANVANKLAGEFYRSHGAVSIDPAAELSAKGRKSGMTVMTTRYCLRRELGACLRDNTSANGVICAANQLSPAIRNLRIRGKGVEFALEFDCKACRMMVKTV